jgi:hypothetical protein
VGIEAVVAEVPRDDRRQAPDPIGAGLDALSLELRAHVGDSRPLQAIAELRSEVLRPARIQEVVADPGPEPDALEVVAQVLGALPIELDLTLPGRPGNPGLSVDEVDVVEALDRLATDGLLDADAGAPRGPEEVVVRELEIPADTDRGIVAEAELESPGLLLGDKDVDVGERRGRRARRTNVDRGERRRALEPSPGCGEALGVEDVAGRGV